MVEIVKELASVLKDLPDMAIWIMLGILFYKVFIIGGSIGLAKYFINKVHDFSRVNSELKHGPKEVTTKYNLSDRFICHDGTFSSFMSLLDEIHSGCGINSNYIHKSDVDFLISAVREKKNREKNGEKNDRQKNS